MAKAAAAQNQDQDGVAFEDGESYTFNMNEQEEDSGFAPIPKGVYPVSIDKCEFKISSKGFPMWNLMYSITEGEFAEQNRKLFDIISLKPEQRGRVKKFINRVAPDLSTLEKFDPKKVAEEGLLIGRSLRVRLDIETSEEYGAQNRVKEHLAPGGVSSGGGFQM